MRLNNFSSAILMLCLAVPVYAQQTLPADELEDLERQIEAGEARAAEQEAEHRRLTNELSSMRQRSIEIAREIQSLEGRMTGIQDRLEPLRDEEAETLAGLNQRRDTLTDILAALQIVERNKPPAVLVQPDDAVDAARSAMLLGAVLPELESQVLSLRAQLDALAAVREAIEQEQNDLNRASDALATEETTLEELVASREALTTQLAESAALEREQVAGFAAEAENLRGLINRLTRRFSSARPVLRPSPNAPRVVSRFTEARGSLRFPAAGSLLSRFGDTLDPGTHSEGIAVATRAGARITAPFDSEIVFAAPYRGYGQLLILSPGDGYLILMSGLARIDGVVGQELLAGEPVGIMGSETEAQNLRSWAVSPDEVEDGKPVLYMEMREDGEPVDPLPWFREDQWRADGS